MKWWDSVKHHPRLIKWANWEYWPSMAFYWPMVLGYPWQALRSGHLCFFTATNPGIYTGGFGLESKYKTVLKIPEPWQPRTVLVLPGKDNFSGVLKALKRADITFPLIAKPDRGYRGLLVKKIYSEGELKAYLERFPIDFLLQEYLDYPEEVGVLYYRRPGSTTGHISSLTLKEFLQVYGDGRRTVRDLILGHPRAILQLRRLQADQADLLDQVPARGERIALGVVGNHAKGTRFINGNHLIDRQLVQTFDRIAAHIEGFSYGRFDIKCSSLEDLRAGQNFKIIEINGVCSEPTHIYDPGGISYYQALLDIWNHWSIVRQIGVGNHRNGAKYLSAINMIRGFLDLFRYRRLVRRLEAAGR